MPEHNPKLARDYTSIFFRHDQIKRQQVLKQKKREKTRVPAAEAKAKLESKRKLLAETSKKHHGVSKLTQIFQAKCTDLDEKQSILDEKLASQVQLREDCDQRLNTQNDALLAKNAQIATLDDAIEELKKQL